jgi:hypothetical protein
MQFRAMELGDVAYTTGLTLNMYSGKFLYTVQNNPSNFSCFFVHKGTHLDKEEQQDCQLFLHLIETKGKGQSIEEINLLNKQIIKAPTTYHEMLLELNFFCGVCTMFFGQFSWAAHLMTSLITVLKKSKHSFKAQERTNPHFCSKFMYAIDTRFQLWLKECMLQTQWNSLDDSILNFTSLIEQVRFGTFELKLLSAFSKPSKPQTKDVIATPKQKGKDNGKK